METLVLSLPTVILLALPVLLIAWLGMEVAELLSEVTTKPKEKVKTEEEGLFVR